jgi:hypothetical protein
VEFLENMNRLNCTFLKKDSTRTNCLLWIHFSANQRLWNYYRLNVKDCQYSPLSPSSGGIAPVFLNLRHSMEVNSLHHPRVSLTGQRDPGTHSYPFTARFCNPEERNVNRFALKWYKTFHARNSASSLVCRISVTADRLQALMRDTILGLRLWGWTWG